VPEALVADKAYDADAIRDDLRKRGIRPVIPPKLNRTKTIRFSKRLYRERNCIERMFGHLKINRAIATRYDQLTDSFLGTLFLASARYWLKFAHAAWSGIEHDHIHLAHIILRDVAKLVLGVSTVVRHDDRRCSRRYAEFVHII
jgi:transposase